MFSYFHRKRIERQEQLVAAWDEAEECHPGLYTRQRDEARDELARLRAPRPSPRFWAALGLGRFRNHHQGKQS